MRIVPYDVLAVTVTDMSVCAYYACAGHVSGAAGVRVEQFRVYARDVPTVDGVQRDLDRRRRQPSIAPTAAYSISTGQVVPVGGCCLRTVPCPISDLCRRRPEL